MASDPAPPARHLRPILRTIEAAEAPIAAGAVAGWLGVTGQLGRAASAHASGSHVKFHEAASTRQLDRDGALLPEERYVPLSRKESKTIKSLGMSGRTRRPSPSKGEKIVDELSLVELTTLDPEQSAETVHL